MARLFHARDRPPPQVIAQLPKGERVVSWGDAPSGSVVIATPAGLWWPSEQRQRFIGWQHVNKAVWKDNLLVVTEAAIVEDMLLVDLPEIAVELSVPRDLPVTVRKRVEANVVRSEVLAVAGGQARFVARRIPGVDGLHWWARLEGNTPDTPVVRAAISERLGMLRAGWNAEIG
jgi:hypothetical protein